PHYAYARSDKKHMPRVSIGGRMVADLLVSAGASRVLTMTLHSSQVHGFFSVPVDHLHALRELASHFRDQDLTGTVVVSPDLGNAKSAAAFAARLGLPVAAGAKERIDDRTGRVTSIIGDVTDRDVIVLDDEIARGTTVIELLAELRKRRVTSVRIACTHGLFADGALERIAAAPEVREIVSTNTVPPPEPGQTGKFTVLSVAPALAEAIRRIHVGGWVGALLGRPCPAGKPGTGGQLRSIARMTCSRVSGRSRTRVPVASASALPIAAATGPWAISPAPVSGCPGAATIRTATPGASVHRSTGQVSQFTDVILARSKVTRSLVAQLVLWIAPPSTWLTTPSGLMTVPTSTASHSRRTRTSFSAATSATAAQYPARPLYLA